MVWQQGSHGLTLLGAEGLSHLIRLERVQNDRERNLIWVVERVDDYQVQCRASFSREDCFVLSGHM